MSNLARNFVANAWVVGMTIREARDLYFSIFPTADPIIVENSIREGYYILDFARENFRFQDYIP